MNAIVSGRAGRALIIDRKSLKSFEVDDPSRIVPRQQADLPYLFGEASDLRVLENTTIESVQMELNAECSFTTALDLTLISLDAVLPDEIRIEALEQLEEFLSDRVILKQLESITYSKLLPPEGDLRGALAFCPDRCSRVTGFLQRLETHQPLISLVTQSWDALPVDVFGNAENREEFKRVAIRAGLFRLFVVCYDRDSITTFFLLAKQNHHIRHLPNYHWVLRAWTSTFDQMVIQLTMTNKSEDKDLLWTRKSTDRVAQIKQQDEITTTRGELNRLGKLLDELDIELEEAYSEYLRSCTKDASMSSQEHIQDEGCSPIDETVTVQFTGDFREDRKQFERSYILRCLLHTNGDLTRAAELLNMHRRSLQYKLKELGLSHYIKPPAIGRAHADK